MVAAALSPLDRATLFLSRVEADSTINPAIRRSIPALRGLAATSPALAIDRLKVNAERYLPGVSRTPPTTALARSVSLSTFYRFHLRPSVRTFVRTDEDYRRMLEGQSDPARILMDHLADDPVLVAWRYSWLTNAADIAGHSAREVVDILAVNQEPPLVIFHFDLADLLREGVTVRRPCSLDSVLGEHEQWSPTGPRSGAAEYLDGDIPRSALSRLEWLS